MVDKQLKDKLKAAITDAVNNSDTVNKAVATNVGKKGSSASVSSRQRVVHRDGETTTVEEHIERRES